MNDERQESFAEQWIDSALGRYSDAEPRPGFETRLLARVAAERDKRTHRGRLWVWAAVAAAAIVVIAIGLNVGRRSETKAPQVAGVTTAPSATGQPPASSQIAQPKPKPKTGQAQGATSVPKAVVARVHRHKPKRLVLAHAEAPKQPQFPTPTPLSEQERLLIAYVESTPKQEIDTVIEQRQAFEKQVNELGVPQEQEKSDR